MAIINLTTMVSMSGIWFLRLSFQSILNSSLWFFFITMARRNGDIIITVSTIHVAFAHQWGSMLRMNGRKNMNMSAVAAADRIE